MPVAPVQPALLALPAGSGGGAALLLHAGLTVREAEVLALVAQGRSNKGISDALTLSVRTVERHIENLYRRIGAHSRFEATATPKAASRPRSLDHSTTCDGSLRSSCVSIRDR